MKPIFTLLTPIRILMICLYAMGATGFSTTSLLQASDSSPDATFELVAKDPTAPRFKLQSSETGTMLEAQVDPADFAIYSSGDTLTGSLQQTLKGYVLGNIFPATPLQVGIMQQVNRAFARDTQLRGKFPYREIGEFMPKFALWDDRGKLQQSDSWKKDFVVMAFIFTRCTQPNMCPLTTLKMKELQSLAQAAGLDNLKLVAVSLDPEYDSPGVMSRYLDNMSVDRSNFLFLSGDEATIESLKAQIGILAEPHEQLIVKHTLMITVFDPVGKIIYRVPGSGWSPQDILKRIQNTQE